jgi:hypothetical protein
VPVNITLIVLLKITKPKKKLMDHVILHVTVPEKEHVVKTKNVKTLLCLNLNLVTREQLKKYVPQINTMVLNVNGMLLLILVLLNQNIVRKETKMNVLLPLDLITKEIVFGLMMMEKEMLMVV